MDVCSLSFVTGLFHSLTCYVVPSHVRLFVAPWTIAHQTPLSMKFSRQEYQSRFPCSPPGNLPDLEIKPMFLACAALAGRFFTSSATWKAISLSIMSSRFIHIVTYDRVFLLFWRLDNSPLYIIHKPHLFFEGRVACFNTLAIVNIAVMNMGVQICLGNPIFHSFRYIPRSGLAG